MVKLLLPWQPRIPAVDANLFEIRESITDIEVRGKIFF